MHKDANKLICCHSEILGEWKEKERKLDDSKSEIVIFDVTNTLQKMGKTLYALV